MGYYINMIDNQFKIKKENFEMALDGLKNAFVPENMNCYDYINGQTYPHFSWVDTHSVLKSRSLGEALKKIRYEPEYNDAGDICNVDFTGQKYGSENVFFAALAPYVEDGSYIAFEGEDGDTWKWQFSNGVVKQVFGTKDCSSQIVEDIKWILFDDREFDAPFEFQTWTGNGNSFVIQDIDGQEYRITVTREES